MGACHKCKCFFCENLCTKKCPLGRVCTTCYKGLNSQNFKITHCDRQAPYDPIVAAPAPKEETHRKRRGERRGKK